MLLPTTLLLLLTFQRYLRQKQLLASSNHMDIGLLLKFSIPPLYLCSAPDRCEDGHWKTNSYSQYRAQSRIFPGWEESVLVVDVVPQKHEDHRSERLLL